MALVAQKVEASETKKESKIYWLSLSLLGCVIHVLKLVKRLFRSQTCSEVSFQSLILQIVCLDLQTCLVVSFRFLNSQMTRLD